MEKTLKLDLINVGYGDAILAQDTEAGFRMLVDCGDMDLGDAGEGSGRITAADFLRMNHIDELDLLVLTHLHRDHAGGLMHLLPGILVREFWTGWLPPGDKRDTEVPIPDTITRGARCLLEALRVYLSALREMRKQGTVIRHIGEAESGIVFTPRFGAAVFTGDASLLSRQEEIWTGVMNGIRDRKELTELDLFINNTSLRLRLKLGGTEVELPGDICAKHLERQLPSPCDILKLPHHGHWDSMTPRLLEMLKPREAVISVSDTRTDNCPAREIVGLLIENRIPVHFTDRVAVTGKPEIHRSVHYEFD